MNSHSGTVSGSRPSDRGATRFLALLVVFVLLATVPAVSIAYPSTGTALPAVLGPLPHRANSTSGFPTPIRHVVTIVAENNPVSTVDAYGSYEMSLAARYPVASSYYAVCHPSASEYLSLTSGQPLQCGSDTVSSYSVPNVGDLISAAPRLSWKAYMESMPSPCDKTDALPYVAHHNPFVYYSDLGANCTANVLPLKAWNESSSTQPNYVFLTPNRYDDGHTPSGSQGVRNFDQWLKGCLSGQGPNASVCGSGGLLHESWFSDSVIFIVYDEAEPVTNVGGYPVSGVSNAWCNSHGASGRAVCGGLVYAIAVSPYTAGVQNYTGNATQYSLLSTTEWLLGLGCTGPGLDCNVGFPALTDWFHFPAPPPSPVLYSVTGSVTSENGTGLANATLYWANSTNRSLISLNASAGFTVELPNGTFWFNASAPGFLSDSRVVVVQGGPVAEANLTLALPFPPVDSVYSVSGAVVDANGSAAQSALVTANNSTFAPVAVSATGNFSISLPNGTFTLTATAAGMTSTTENVTVEGASVNVSTLVLWPPEARYSINGTVSDPDGEPLPSNTTVTALGPNVTVTVPVLNGSFRLTLPNGSYQLVVEAPDLLPVSSNLSVDGHATETQVPLEFGAAPVSRSAAPGYVGPTLIVILLAASISLVLAWERVLRGRLRRRPPVRWLRLWWHARHK